MRPPPGDTPHPIESDMRGATVTSGELQHPCWALLSSLGCIVLTAAGGVLWNVAPSTGVLGLDALCRAGGLPAVLQVALVLLLFALGWVVAYAFGHGLQAPRLRDVETLLPITAMFGGFGAVLGVGSLLLGHVAPGVAAVALLPAVVAVWTFLYGPPARPAPPPEQP
jgi:hypothetical protein